MVYTNSYAPVSCLESLTTEKIKLVKEDYYIETIIFLLFWL